MNWLMMDMDSYFASVEQLLRPELRGRPVGVVPVESDFTSIIAASSDAKRFGVRTGTQVREARRLCPGLRLIQARPKVYVQVHHRILNCVDQCAPIEKVYSIDEWTVRLLGPERETANALALGRRIKQAMRTEFGPWLTSSIGIGATRFLAKTATKLQKPDGLTALSVDDLPGRIAHWELQDLHGIGQGMAARLQQHGVQTVCDLWNLTQQQTVEAWGSVCGARWWAGLHGIDEAEPVTRRQSMTHGNVLDPKFRNDEGARCILTRLVCKLGERLRRNGYFARSLQLSLLDEQRHSFSDEIGMPATQDTPTLLHQFTTLWNRRRLRGKPVKKVDVTVAGLVPATQVSRSLFSDTDRLQRVSHAIDQINSRLGELKVYFGPVHDYRHLMENKIAFGRIPELDHGSR